MGYPNPPIQRPDVPMDWLDPFWLDSGPSELEVRFARLWLDVAPQLDLYTEARLIPGRQYRFDFAHYPSMVAIEIQGNGPGHYSRAGVNRDNEKHRLAASEGWLVTPVESALVDDRETHNRVVAIISQRMLTLKEAA